MNTMDLDKLTQGELFVVKWQYGRLGGFMTSLAETIGRADVINKVKLKLAYPDEVDAMINFYEVDGWWDEVQKKANIK